MKKLKYIISFVITLAFFASCQDDDVSIGEIKAPSNITVDVEIVGADANNPTGDGSGTVIFRAQADDAVSYSLRFAIVVSFKYLSLFLLYLNNTYIRYL